jgi:hypothetical protein
MSETTAAGAPDSRELEERARALRARFAEFRGRL